MTLAARRQRLGELYRSNHLARNSGYVILTTAVSGLLGMAYWAMSARVFPVGALGVASALLAAMTFASAFATIGLGTTVLQVLPTADDELWCTAVNALVFAGAAFGGLAGGGLALVLPLLSPRLAAAETPFVVACIVAGTAVLTLATLLDYVFQAARAAQFTLVRGFTFGTLKLALLGVPVVLSYRSADWIVASWIAAAAVVSAITLRWQIASLGRRYRLRLTGTGRYLASRARLLVLHHLTTLGSVLIPSLMPVLVVARLSSEANAHFYIAWLLSSILITVSSAVSGNLLADVSYDVTRLGARVRSAVRLIALLMLPPAAALAALGRPILSIFGHGYAVHSYGILLLFIVVAVPDAVTNVYVSVLRAQGRPATAAAMNLAMAAIALGGAWFLMPRLGVAGAAWAWALSQAAGAAFALVHGWTGRERTPRPLAAVPLSTLENAAAREAGADHARALTK